ncbi:TPA: hypothetical protein HA251_06810 [Candidatus Woesearchaeota archaeon]|nr:hypothetical protein [Candidatus Woesearchaeota archaeon]
MKSIYQVMTEGDEEGRSFRTIGYARGEPNVIEAYFDNEKMYRIYTSEIHVTDLSVVGPDIREKLVSTRSKLEKRLEELQTRQHKELQTGISAIDAILGGTS